MKETPAALIGRWNRENIAANLDAIFSHFCLFFTKSFESTAVGAGGASCPVGATRRWSSLVSALQLHLLSRAECRASSGPATCLSADSNVKRYSCNAMCSMSSEQSVLHWGDVFSCDIFALITSVLASAGWLDSLAHCCVGGPR